MSIQAGKGKVTKKKSGAGYKNVWIYVPSNLSRDSAFPFKDGDDVEIEIRDKQMIIRPHNTLKDRISEYGMENVTLKHLIETKAVENQERPFLYFNDEIYSYQQINAEANRIAHGIMKLVGEYIKQNPPKIAVFLPNCPEFFFCWFGISKTGMIFVPVDRFLRGDSLKFVLDHCDCEYLVLDYEFLESFKEIRAALPRIKKVIIRNPPADFKSDEFYRNLTEIVSNDTSNPNIPIITNDIMEIIYTEGTTGNPKGVVYRNMKVLSGLIISEGLGSGRYGQVKLIYCPAPLYQAFFQLDIIFPTMFLNASIAIAERFDASTFWEDVRRYKADLIIYYGGILQTLFNQAPRDNDRDQPAKWAIGGEAPRHIWENFENRFGITLIEGWGATEAVASIINRRGSRGGKLGSIGIPLDGFEVKVVDENGKELPPGPQHIGEIITKTFTPSLLEYYKEPEATPMIRGKDGYVYTGDMAYRDKDGYLYYTGRKADIIKRLGGSIPA